MENVTYGNSFITPKQSIAMVTEELNEDDIPEQSERAGGAGLFSLRSVVLAPQPSVRSSSYLVIHNLFSSLYVTHNVPSIQSHSGYYE